MFRAYLIEMTLLALACWFLFWGATKLYFIIKHEVSAGGTAKCPALFIATRTPRVFSRDDPR